MYSSRNNQIAINISNISDASNRYLISKFSQDTQLSINTVQDYINNTLYPILHTLTSGPNYHDVLDNGISGETIVSYLGASPNDGAMFWDLNSNRCKTIKESLSYIQSIAIGNQTILNTIVNNSLESRVEILEGSNNQQNEDITNLNFNLIQLAKDVWGNNYTFTNNSNQSVDSPIIEQLDGKISLTEKGSVNGVATLDPNGKIPIGQIPDLAITSVQVVDDATARDALDNVQDGDVVKTSDNNKVYMLKSLTPNKEWIEISADVQDLSDYARKSLSNTFTAKNIFKNDSANEIITVEDNSQPFAKFIKNQKQFETYNLISGRNLSSTPEDGTSQFYGTALFKTNIIKIGTDPFYDMSGKAPIEIEDDGKTNINMNGWTSINRTVSQGNQSIDNKYFLKLNTNQAMTEDAYILKIGPDYNQESLMNGFFKWKGTTGDFVVHKDPHSNSSDQSLATTNWVRTLLNNSGGNIDTSNFAKLNVNNIYNTGVTNHFKGLIKTDSYIKLNVADSSRITRSHIGNDQNDTPLIAVTEDVDIGADTKTVLIDIERDSGFYPLADIDSIKNHAQILWNETESTRSWMLSHSPLSNSNDTSIATTNWVMEKVNAVSGESADPLIKNNIFINEQLKFKDIVGPSIVLNYDTTTLESANAPNPIKNAIIQVYRGSNGTGAELKWNESDDVWEVSPPPSAESNSNAIATTSWIVNKLNSLNLNDLNDVNISATTNNTVLKYSANDNQWIAAQLSSSNLSNDSSIAKKNIDNNFSVMQRGTNPAQDASTTELVTAQWVRNLLNSIGANPITNLNSLTDVTISGAQNNHYLKYSNNQWINSFINVSDINGLNLSNYAPILSPSFTGAPSLAANATELPADDNSRRLVTSAWVRNLISVNTSFDGILTNRSLVFISTDNTSDGIVWNTFNESSFIYINKILSKTTLVNTAFKPNNAYYETLVVFNNSASTINLGGVRPGFPYIKNDIPQSGNFSHNIFMNGNNSSINNAQAADNLRSQYTVTYLNNNGEIDNSSRLQYRDDIIVDLKSFCFINPFSKDLFLLSNDTFISDGTFNNQKLFVKNVSSSNLTLGINSCSEIFPDNSWMSEYTMLRKFYTIPSKASIEFVWLSFYKAGYNINSQIVYTGAWYPKIINGNVTVVDQSGTMYNHLNNQISWPPSLVDTVNKFFPSDNNNFKNLT